MQFAAKLAEVPLWGKKLISINGIEVVLINDNGNISACESDCPHQGSPLLAGIVKEGFISCPRHGWNFDLASGACTNHTGYTLKTYQVEVVGNDILIELGWSPMKLDL